MKKQAKDQRTILKQKIIADIVRLIRLYGDKYPFDASDKWWRDDAIVSQFESFLREYDYLGFAKNYSKRNYELIATMIFLVR